MVVGNSPAHYMQLMTAVIEVMKIVKIEQFGLDLMLQELFQLLMKTDL